MKQNLSKQGSRGFMGSTRMNNFLGYWQLNSHSGRRTKVHVKRKLVKEMSRESQMCDMDEFVGETFNEGGEMFPESFVSKGV